MTLRLLLLNALFLLAAAGAWAWYHVNPPVPPVRYAFALRPDPEGYRFRSEPLAENAVATLATTNLVNGTFYGPQGQRIAAFMGTWSAANSKELSVVQHTPDICWVSAGWAPVALDHPAQVELTLGGKPVPFEVRTFRAPGGGAQELTLWCTLVNGEVRAEGQRFGGAGPGTRDQAGDQRALQADNARRLAGGQFLNAVRRRNAGSGDKQFVRFSAPVSGDWRPALRELQEFGQRWLQLAEQAPAPRS